MRASWLFGVLRRWWLKRTLPPQSCFVYCKCGWELCAGGQYRGEVEGGLESYDCARCGRYSAWLFDAPAPIRITIWQR